MSGPGLPRCARYAAEADLFARHVLPHLDHAPLRAAWAGAPHGTEPVHDTHGGPRCPIHRVRLTTSTSRCSRSAPTSAPRSALAQNGHDTFPDPVGLLEVGIARQDELIDPERVVSTYCCPPALVPTRQLTAYLTPTRGDLTTGHARPPCGRSPPRWWLAGHPRRRGAANGTSSKLWREPPASTGCCGTLLCLCLCRCRRTSSRPRSGPPTDRLVPSAPGSRGTLRCSSQKRS
jgi:hypothetical protein